MSAEQADEGVGEAENQFFQRFGQQLERDSHWELISHVLWIAVFEFHQSTELRKE